MFFEHFRIAKVALDHAKRMFNLGPYLRFRVLDLASPATDQTFFTCFFTAAGPGGYRPDYLTVLMLWAFVQSGATRIPAHLSFLAVQERIDLCHVRYIRRGAHQAMHQAGFGVDADMRFHPAEVLVSFLRLMHLGRVYRPCSWSNSAHE